MSFIFRYVCPLCQGTGDNAHTRAYCPIVYAIVEEIKQMEW